MTEARLALGRWGEELAVRYLKRQGMKILAQNLRTPVGEIDIIARLRRELVFVEVKTRSSQLYGSPQEAVGAHKQRQILRAAQWYLNEQPALAKLQPRFDVVAILGSPDAAQIEHLRNAFDAG